MSPPLGRVPLSHGRARILSEARRRASLTQLELAQGTGIPRETVARIETRTRIPRVDTLDRLLEACGAGLILTRRLGLGVDRDPIRQVLARSPELRLKGGSQRILVMLAVRGARFVVICATAERLQGAPETTDEVWICDPAHSDNRRRVDDVADRLQRWRIRSGTLHIAWMPPPPFDSFDDLARGTDHLTVREHRIAVASLDDLIRIRLASGSSAQVLGAVRDELDAQRVSTTA